MTSICLEASSSRCAPAVWRKSLYERQVKPLAHAERLKLLALIASDLAIEPPKPTPRQRSLLELEGLGAEIWQGIDAQEYVNELREEWKQRS